MKDILVPIDFSIYSLSAAKTAAAIIRKSGGNIHLLHIADIPVGWEKQPLRVQQEYPLLEERLMQAKVKIEKFSNLQAFKDCNTICHVHGGVPFEQITLFAKRNKIDLIVMGVHGAGDSDLKFIGSTAQRVMRTTTSPVLGVKKGFNLGSLKKILFASDFDENVSPAINMIKELAIDFGASIDLAYINTPTKFVDDVTMDARIGKFTPIQKKVKFHTVIQNSMEKEEGILQCAKKRNASMIAMVTHLKRQKAVYLLGVTETVLFRSKLPVLSFIID